VSGTGLSRIRGRSSLLTIRRYRAVVTTGSVGLGQGNSVRSKAIKGPANSGKRFVLCPPRSTDSLTRIVAVPIGTVREPRSRWTKVGCQLDLFCSRPAPAFSR